MHIESLETRRLLAAAAGYALTIQGTDAADVITLNQRGSSIVVSKNGVTTAHTTWGLSGGVKPGTGTPWTITKIIINGLRGHDVITADNTVKMRLEIRGGAGNDFIRGGAYNDSLYGGLGGTTSAENWSDTIEGGNGDDLIIGSEYYANLLKGGAGKDNLFGGSNRDSIYGDDGNDYILGHDGDDALYGGAGHDSLYGLAGKDSLYGGLNDDYLDGGGSADYMSGQTGFDTVDYGSRTTDLKIDQNSYGGDGTAGENDTVSLDIRKIISGSGNDTIRTSYKGVWVVAGNGNDTVRGGLGDDTFIGGFGDDVLYGNGGNDWLAGDGGDDRIYGGAGIDTLLGGGDDDTLVSIGGGAFDQLHGGGGMDGFWADADASEIVNAASVEHNTRRVHRVDSFANGAHKEQTAPNFPDPGLHQSEKVAVTHPSGTQSTDDNPLFSSLGPEPDDIRQGALGDCWFLATLAAVAKSDPDVISQSVVDLGDGTYAVMFFESGQRRFYRVDNDLPIVLGMTNIAYARPGFEGALWGPIMEKAYAIHQGGGDYDGLDGGWAQNAFDDLGIAREVIDVDDDDVMQTIKNHLAAGRPVTIGSVDGEFKLGDSYVMSHQYMVRSVNDNGTITLYNPWGNDAQGGWVFGADDGFVTFTQQSVIDLSEDFVVGFI